MMIERDEFDLWRAHPVTKWIMNGIRKAQAQEKAEWIRISWDASPPDGKTSPAALIELRATFDALDDVLTNDFEEWSKWNGDEPERD